MKEITVAVSGVNEAFLVKRKKSKRLSMSMEKKGVLIISIPFFLPYRDAEAILKRNEDWVEKYVRRMQKVEARQEFLLRGKTFYNRDEAEKIIEKRVREISTELKLAYNGLRISEFKTRWGSCNGQNRISMNSKLVSLPVYLMEYVIVHELVHTKIKNHKIEFWEEVEKYLPGARDMDRALKKYYPLFL